jgi:ribosomal protein S12 methylthiotransferase
MALKTGLVSLGCPKNLVDSEIMLGLLQASGFEITNREQDAEVLIVNTCSFIQDAREESIKTILELAQYKKRGRCRALLVAGCLAQRYPREMMAELPEVDAVLGTGSIPEITGVIQRVLQGERVSLVGTPGYLHTAGLPKLQATPSYSAYLKIAEGCDNCCTYCIIPHLRGPYRSREADDILAEAAAMASRGVKELNLVAQDTTRYGMDRYGKPYLNPLLRRLSRLEGVVWIRLLYTYPTLLNEELIQLIAGEKKICHYLDIPLQHASASVLRRMNRRGSGEGSARLIEKIRAAIPDITLRTSFIVGFPGETEADFEELLGFIAGVQFERVGIFTYSREEGTPGAELPDQVPEEVKLERKNRAMTLQQKISLKKNRLRLGQVLTVLVEGRNTKGVYHGRSEGDAPDIDGKVYFKANAAVKVNPGDFVKVRVTSARPYDLIGELV